MSTEDSGSEQKPITTIVFTKKRGKFIYVGIFSVLAVIIIVAALLVISKSLEKSKPTGNCAHDAKSTACQELKAAIPLLSPTKVKQLSPVVTKIQTLNNYKKDVNLEYVLLTYDINTSNATTATKDYNLLASDYKPKVGYDPLLKGSALSPALLKQVVSALQNYAKHPNYNVTGISQKP